MRTLLIRLVRSALALALCGALASTTTFYLVSRTDENASRRFVPGAELIAHQGFASRFGTWVTTVVRSGFRDWGSSETGVSVVARLRERLPITLALGSVTWLLAWGMGMGLGVLLVARSPSIARRFGSSVFPVTQAIPTFPVVLLVFVCLATLQADAGRTTRAVLACLTLTALQLPVTTALWLNALLRIHDREFVRVARAKGLAPAALWARHVLPNALMSSGILAQAAYSLAALLVGVVYIERVFTLGGAADEFIEAVCNGHCELAATATVLFFSIVATGVLLGELVEGLVDPAGDTSNGA